jgi:hypothetical protein
MILDYSAAFFLPTYTLHLESCIPFHLFCCIYCSTYTLHLKTFVQFHSVTRKLWCIKSSKQVSVSGTVMIHGNATPPNSEFIHGSTGKIYKKFVCIAFGSVALIDPINKDHAYRCSTLLCSILSMVAKLHNLLPWCCWQIRYAFTWFVLDY